MLASLSSRSPRYNFHIFQQRRVQVEPDLYTELLYQVSQHKASARPSPTDSQEHARECRHTRLGWRCPALYDEDRSDGDLIGRLAVEERGEAVLGVELGTQLVVNVVHDAARRVVDARWRSQGRW